MIGRRRPEPAAHPAERRSLMVRRGDRVVPLEDRLDALEAQNRWLGLGLALILALHVPQAPALLTLIEHALRIGL